MNKERFWAIFGWTVATILGAALWARLQAPIQIPPEKARNSAQREQSVVVDLVDTNYPIVAKGEPGWDYYQSVAADLNGDGQDETVIIMARVERSPNRPREFLWDDGQPWQVLIQSAQGEITHVYSRWVQIGHLKGLIGDEEDNGAHPLILLELTGAGLSVYKVEYRGPHETETTRLVALPVVNQAGPAFLPSQ